MKQNKKASRKNVFVTLKDKFRNKKQEIEQKRFTKQFKAQLRERSNSIIKMKGELEDTLHLLDVMSGMGQDILSIVRDEHPIYPLYEPAKRASVYCPELTTELMVEHLLRWLNECTLTDEVAALKEKFEGLQRYMQSEDFANDAIHPMGEVVAYIQMLKPELTADMIEVLKDVYSECIKDFDASIQNYSQMTL